MTAIIVSLGGSCEAWALSAKLLPQGVSRVRIFENMGGGDQWFSDSKERQPLGQVGLDKLTAKGIPTTVANGYAIDNQARYRLWRTDVTLDYGVTDDLSLGLWWPFFSHDTRQSTSLSQGAGWSSLGTVQKATIAGAVATLDDTDPKHSGVGDLFIGFKNRVTGTNKDPFRLALGGGVRIPTGHVANPLNADDVSTGDGQWDLGLDTWTDYQLTDHFFVNFLTRHDYGLAAHRSAAFPTNAARGGKQKFQPGMAHHLELVPQYHGSLGKWDFLPEVGLLYDVQNKEKRQNFDTTAGEFSGSMASVATTDWQRWMVKPGMGIRLFQFGIPADIYLSYTHTLTGKNTVDLDLVELRMDFFFNGRED
ncbi:MAG: hypothetical protein HQL75_14935 [Magnetococcales bacterium]|nr:hypothetical protein [Magnetococcales bacterium]